MLEKTEEEGKENTMREGKFLQLEKERKEEIVGRNLQERKKEENELFAECIFLSDSDEEEETVQVVKEVVEVVDLDGDEPIIIVQGKVVEEKERETVEENEREIVEEDSQDRQEEQYFSSSSSDSGFSNHDYNTNCNIVVGIGMLTPILEDEEDDYNSSSVTCEVSSNDDRKISSLFLCFHKLIGLHISPFFHSLSISLIHSFFPFLLQ